MNGPDYRTAAEYFSDKAHAARRAVLDGTEKPPAKTNAERQREFRQRKADTEATEVRGIFSHPDDHAEVKEAAAKIARRRQRLAKRSAP